MGHITCKERRPKDYHDEEVTYTYEEIEEVFNNDPESWVMKLLTRVKELEEENSYLRDTLDELKDLISNLDTSFPKT